MKITRKHLAAGFGATVAACSIALALTALGTASVSVSAGLSSALPALKLKGNARRGKNIFVNVAGCNSCHALKDAQATGDTGPNLDTVRPRPTFALVVRRVSLGVPIKAGSFITGMPAFTKLPGAQFAPFVLTNQQIADVAAYVSTVAGRR